jgi:two-component system, OmpR family, KDP operon response regulator KdpE
MISSIRKLLHVTLETHGYDIIEATTEKDGVLQASMIRPYLIILDLGQPDTGRMDVLAQVRDWYTGPILVLTVQEDERGKIFALDHGADPLHYQTVRDG